MIVAPFTLEHFCTSFPERAQKLVWFFGAGTSAASGIATGYDMILDFKTRLFCAEVGVSRRQVDPTDPLWKDRIESYFDGAHGLPPLGSPEEYAAAFEAVHSTVEARRSYVDAAIRNGRPSYAHRVFAALSCTGLAPCVFTTNFDPLVENSIIAANEVLPTGTALPTVAALDSADRAVRAVRDDDWPLVVKLHGDYKSDRLLNTTPELEQDNQLREQLVTILGRFGLAVVGYSGRDRSVMDGLLEAAQVPGSLPGGLFWFARRGATLMPSVVELLEAAAATTSAHLIEVDTFDELAGGLDRQLRHPPELEAYVRGHRPAPVLRPVAIPTEDAGTFPVLRTSALLVTALPQRARRFDLAAASTTTDVQQILREKRAQGSIACQGAMVAAFGSDDDLIDALAPFGASLVGHVDVDPVVDSWALGLLYDAIVRALARGRPLRTRMRRSGHIVVLSLPSRERQDATARKDRATLEPLRQAYGESIVGTVPGLGFPYAEAVRIRLEYHVDKWWLVFEPLTWVDEPRRDPDTRPDPQVRAQLADWGRERWAQRYNRKWANVIEQWSKLLAPERHTTLTACGLAEGAGIDAEFSLYQATAWSRPGRQWPADVATGTGR